MSSRRARRAQLGGALAILAVGWCFGLCGCRDRQRSAGEERTTTAAREAELETAPSREGGEPVARLELAFGTVEELLSQIVVIERVGVGSRAVPSCVGTVIEHEASLARVLTAAHCVPEMRRGSFEPLRVVSSLEASAVKSILSDSRFRGSALPSAYDAAVLEFSARPTAGVFGARWVTEDKKAIVPGALLEVAWMRNDGHTLELSEARVVAETSLTISTELDIIGDCRGMSGAPAFLRQRDFVRFVGVISSGATHCQGTVNLTRVAAVATTLVLREPPRLPSCGECIDRLELDAGECKTSLRRCRADTGCSKLLGCLRNQDAAACPMTLESGPGLSLARCACAHGCLTSCAPLCGTRTPLPTPNAGAPNIASR